MNAQAPGATAYERHFGPAVPAQADRDFRYAAEVALLRTERTRAALTGALIGLVLIAIAVLGGLLLVTAIFGSGSIG